jgi:hypothetical protein
VLTPIAVAPAGNGLMAHFPDVVRRGLAAYREGTGHVTRTAGSGSSTAPTAG